MDIILHYFPELTDLQKNQIASLSLLYKSWNEKINIISRKDIDFLYERHVLHSLSIARLYPLPEGAEVLDIGTGGGFPGIPLAILFPKVSFTLIDSIGKKISVVQDIVSNLSLTNVIPLHERAQNLKRRFHFITSRAVTNYADFYRLCKNNIARESKFPLKNGIFYLKGGDFEEEVRGVKGLIIHNLSELFKEEYFYTKKLIYHVPFET